MNLSSQENAYKIFQTCIIFVYFCTRLNFQAYVSIPVFKHRYPFMFLSIFEAKTDEALCSKQYEVVKKNLACGFI